MTQSLYPDVHVRTELEWTPEAWDKYHEIGAQIEHVRAYYGDGPANEMHHTFAVGMMSMFSAGRTRVTRAFDYDGLYFITPVIACGLVFHQDSPEVMKHRLARHGFHYTNDEVCADWPRTGEWGMHS